MEFLFDIGSFVIDSIEVVLALLVIAVVALFVYDKFIQRQHALLINYPVIGRFRYLFEALREPLRQYFAEENFYQSKEKVDWVYKAAKDLPNYVSFSLSQPYDDSRFLIKHSQSVLNEDEVDSDFSITIGEGRKYPFRSISPIVRSAMSDGSLSPEAVRSFALAAVKGKFTVNIGEGGLTSNHLYSHRPDYANAEYLEIVKSGAFAKVVFRILNSLINIKTAGKQFRKMVIRRRDYNTYIVDYDTLNLFRVNWDAPLDKFPKDVPEDVQNIIFQISSALFGVRNSDGEFDEERYQKVMRFCRMTEIKIAQGAKQTGGKLAGSKVTADIAYYRGVEEGKDVFSPNRFPYAKTTEELLDFVEKLQNLSDKPVGFKIVISDIEETSKLVKKIADRKKAGKSIPDFITIDSGDGGSGTAPLELMESIGLNTTDSIFIMDKLLRDQGIRDDIKVIASGKILTPDDVVIALALGADLVGIARGFMMSGGCIRARLCSGYGSHVCPVGMATQDEKKRASYLVIRKSLEIANYHRNLIKGITTILAVMGVDKIEKLDKKHLSYRTSEKGVFFDVSEYFRGRFSI